MLLMLTVSGHGGSPAEYKPTQPQLGEYHYGTSDSAVSYDTVLNRQVGNEFGSVEALWSQFENFMGRPEGENGDGKQNEGHDGSNQGGNEGEDNTVVQER